MREPFYYYGAVFGTGDSSDPIENEIELNDDERKLWDLCVRYFIDMNEVPALRKALDREYQNLKTSEEENLVDGEDEYAIECLGLDRMDPDELDDLVYDRDENALAFFGLDEETAEDWSADDLDELPLRKDFDPDFTPISPFDEGYSLNLWYPEPDELNEEVPAINTDEELLAFVREFMMGTDCDRKMLKMMLEANEDYVGSDNYGLQEAMIETAKKMKKRELAEALENIHDWEDEDMND